MTILGVDGFNNPGRSFNIDPSHYKRFLEQVRASGISDVRDIWRISANIERNAYHDYLVESGYSDEFAEELGKI